MIKAAKLDDSHGYLEMPFPLLDLADTIERHVFDVQIGDITQEDWKNLQDANNR